MAQITETLARTAGIGADSRQLVSVDLVAADAVHTTLRQRVRITLHLIHGRSDGGQGRPEAREHAVEAEGARAPGLTTGPTGPVGWTVATATAVRNALIAAFDGAA